MTCQALEAHQAMRLEKLIRTTRQFSLTILSCSLAIPSRYPFVAPHSNSHLPFPTSDMLCWYHQNLVSSPEVQIPVFMVIKWAGRLLAATSVAGPSHPCRLHDRTTDTRFLVDTGAEVSIPPLHVPNVHINRGISTCWQRDSDIMWGPLTHP